ncbi:MAG TPA: glycosyltransferase [Pseudonocardia sp.]|nr:glycosyltransferase [Pseudonocardia sp.]
MRIAVLSLDTRGGVQPYAALALGLQRAGHDVRLLASEDFAPGLRARGLDVVALSGDSQATVRASGGVAEMGRLETVRFMREQTARHIGRQVEEIVAGCTDADLMTGGVGGMVVGLPVAEKLGLPFLEAHLQPLGPPTGAYPGVLTPHVPRWLGAPGRRWSHRLSSTSLRVMFGHTVRLARAELGLPARPAPRRADLPTLYGYSSHVLPVPPEWGPDRHVTGYWMLPHGDSWSPPPALEAFLAAGPSPVCIGFGSMAGKDPEALTALVTDAVRRAGLRAVLLSGWGGLQDLVGDAGDVLVLDEAPHDWLLPRCVAVVHHGGAGTTGAALAAGVPAIVVPFGVDQPFWGSRVAALGAGPTPIPRRRLTADALADALRATAADRGMRERAAELGTRIRAEDGVARAVEHYAAVAARVA